METFGAVRSCGLDEIPQLRLYGKRPGPSNCENAGVRWPWPLPFEHGQTHLRSSASVCGSHRCHAPHQVDISPQPVVYCP